MIIPHQMRSPEVLQDVIEAFVTREGTALEALQGTPVVLSLEGKTVHTQNIDELGNFVISSISPAPNRLPPASACSPPSSPTPAASGSSS